MDYSKLEQLHALREKGVITEEEYNEQKAKILNSISNPLPLNLNDSNYCAIMNFIQILFGAGWIVVLIMWIVGKDKSEKVNKQGIILLNWAISCAIYSAAIGLLALISFGFTLFLLPVLGVASTVFAILGGVKALDGEIWEYPLTINIIK